MEGYVGASLSALEHAHILPAKKEKEHAYICLLTKWYRWVILDEVHLS
jgi:hypothetical protein